MIFNSIIVNPYDHRVRRSACKEQTSGFHGARFKKFDTLESAEEFVITGTKNKDGDADTKKGTRMHIP